MIPAKVFRKKAATVVKKGVLPKLLYNNIPGIYLAHSTRIINCCFILSPKQLLLGIGKKLLLIVILETIKDNIFLQGW